jgi:hypothetical protein
MRRLKVWFIRIFGPPVRRTPVEPLPFTPEEFARLIRSGKSEDMKLLADGLSRGAISRAQVW